MSEQKNVSLREKYLKSKPKIEEIIPECLDGDTKKAALYFVAYMRINKMPPSHQPSLRYKCNYFSRMKSSRVFLVL